MRTSHIGTYLRALDKGNESCGMMASGSVWGREPMTRNRRELEKYLPWVWMFGIERSPRDSGVDEQEYRVEVSKFL